MKESTKAKIRAAIAADPTRWTTEGGNANGPRQITIDGHEITIGWDPLDQAWAIWEQTSGEAKPVEI
jgi:hypothetical protein